MFSGASQDTEAVPSPSRLAVRERGALGTHPPSLHGFTSVSNPAEANDLLSDREILRPQSGPESQYPPNELRS